MLWQRIEEQKSISINRISVDWAEAVSFYRFLNNERVKLDEVIESQIERFELTQVKRHVLAVNDTTSINLQRHLGRLKEEALGYIGGGAGKHIGFHLHPTLILAAENFHHLGFGSIQVWVREKVESSRKAGYKQLAVEEKESYKWIRAAEETKQNLPLAEMLTLIGDREADCYEEFVRVPDERTHLLVRSCQNRRLADGGNLYERLSEQTVVGEYEIKVEADNRARRAARVAKIEVWFGAVEIAAPAGFRGAAKSVCLQVVEARERAAPVGVEPILWRLLTTHAVRSYGDARTIIGYYRQRWRIEEVFRVLKRQGLDIESSAMEAIESIKKLSVIALSVALRTVQLTKNRRGGEQKLKEVFSEAEINCLKQVNAKVEGRTEKQRNPHQPDEIGYGAWIIARLGGWKSYESQRPPGVITMKRGLLRFETILYGYSLTCV
jgi:cell division protein FtsB